jgi:hypothetical protein
MARRRTPGRDRLSADQISRDPLRRRWFGSNKPVNGLDSIEIKVDRIPSGVYCLDLSQGIVKPLRRTLNPRRPDTS